MVLKEYLSVLLNVFSNYFLIVHSLFRYSTFILGIFKLFLFLISIMNKANLSLGNS